MGSQFWRSLGGFALALACAVSHAETTTFVSRTVVDSTPPGGVALTYLVPKGWRSNDSVAWHIAYRTAPMWYAIWASSPDGSFHVSYRNMIFNLYNRLPAHKTGDDIPPDAPFDLAISDIRRDHPGVKVDVLEQTLTPRKSIFLNYGSTRSRAYSFTGKFRYLVNGAAVVSKQTYKFDGYDIGTPWGRAHGFSHGNWYVTDWTVVSGPEREFSRAMKLGAVVLSSTRMDPSFFQKYAETLKFEGGIIRNQGLAMLRHSLSPSNRQAFEAQMAASDRHTRDFCDSVLDRERYTDGTIDFILPSGYNRAATNGTDYLLTSDPTFSATGQWRELRKLR